MLATRRRLLGVRYAVAPTIAAEVRKSCRNELQILYSGGPFAHDTWRALTALGQLSILEASKINPRMKDLARIVGPQLRIEGPHQGEYLVAFFARRGRPMRRQLEATLRATSPVP